MRPTSDQDKHSPAHETLELVLTAEWTAPSIVRGRLREWLAGHHWPAAHVDELVLAISEAVSNSIEHGYGVQVDTAGRTADLVEVHGEIASNGDGFRHAAFTVRDHGTWRAPTNHQTSRGHGMRIMHMCAAEVAIKSTATGTTVNLRSHPVPPTLN